MHTQSLRALVHALKNKSISSTELTTHYLKRIQQATELNAFISLDEDRALKAAKHADTCIQNGRTQVLTGIPMAHKDIFCTNSMPTTCGSKMLADFHAPYQATIVSRFADHGAIMLGKTNMDEFAMGSTNEYSYFGPVKNPWNLDYVPGGSSGGSAAAVAARLIPFATGSDTGGSIRQPAAFCGISGLKPTYGLISRFGMLAYATSLDQAGPMAQSADDLALILELMAGFDERDSTSSNQHTPNYSAHLNLPIKSMKIGIPTGAFHPNVDTAVQQAIRLALKIYEEAGAEIVEVDITLQSLWVPCYYVIACAEASSNLSRYDGVRFGYRTKSPANLHELITRSRSEGFGMEVKRRILTGTHVLSSGYFDDYYLQAQKIRRLIQQELQQVLQQVDIILGPTTPTCAFPLGETQNDPTARYLADIFTVGANLSGLPAISIPVGFSNGLPIGMQLMGGSFDESRLLQAAHFYQKCTKWHLDRPEFGDNI